VAIQAAELKAKIGLDVSDLERGVQRARGTLGEVATTFTSFASHAAAAAAGFIIRDVVIGSWQRLKELIAGTASELVGANRSWERFETQLGVQLKSQIATAERLQELETFAVQTPFNLDEIIEADVILQNFGLHSQGAMQAFGKSGAEIRTIAGDTAAGTGAAFKEIGMWLGRFAAGDTGMAIMRFQELGVTTRTELAAMGVEFSKAGQLVSPLDEAMTALLTVMERKFGGLMDTQSRTLGGMESNLGDFMSRQKRLWGEPVFEEYKSGLGDLLGFLDSEGVQRAMDTGRNLWASLVGWIGDVARDWAADAGGLAVDALHWGANVVEQFAAGIQGSGAVVDALNSMASEITSWLEPGSPPRILPELTEWGTGAARAYWEGWAGAEPEIGMWLQDAMKSLEPHLKGIEGAGGLTDEGLAQYRGAFGAEAPRFEGYLQAYGGLVEAARTAAEAQTTYDAAVAEGDEQAIAAAEGQLDTARDQERTAQRRVAAEQSRISQQMSAEARLTQVVEQRARAEESAAQNAADRAAEAEQKRIADARLRWELAVAETPEAQIGIWQRELAAATEGSADYYDILTRIVQLEQRARDAADSGGTGGAGLGSWAADAGEQAVEDAREAAEGAVEKEKIDWRGIGKAIGGALLDGIIGGVASLGTRLNEWADKPETQDTLFTTGSTLGGVVGNGIRGLFGQQPEVDSTATSMTSHIQNAAWQAATGAYSVGMQLADAVFFGFAAALLPGDATAAQLAAAWEMGGIGGKGDIGAGIGLKLTGDADLAAEIAEQWRQVAQDPDVPPAVQAAADAQAQALIDQYDLRIHGDLGVMTADAYQQLAIDEGIIGAAGTSGAAAGAEYGQSFVDKVLEYLRNGLPPALQWLWPEPSKAAPDDADLGHPGYAEGGVVTRPTLAWIGETGPEAVVPLDGRHGFGDIYIQFLGPVNNPDRVTQKVLSGLRSVGVPA
jgi:hypothetical protein